MNTLLSNWRRHDRVLLDTQRFRRAVVWLFLINAMLYIVVR